MASVTDLTRYICLFHSADRARAAVDALEKAGVSRSNITTLGDRSDAGTDSGSASLSELGVPDRDLHHLQDGLRRGGVLVSLEAPESRNSAVERIFHHYSADKIDETELSFDDADSRFAEAAVPAEVVASTLPPATGEYRNSDVALTDQAVIPVAQEELLVGKREVDRGGARVLRRTVEEPVQRDVNLHAERVVLEYREVNRPVTDADLQAGTQQIELVETAEVPVVQKVARVVEEVHVGKIESDRTEVINDTVRHTEVEVEPVNTTDTTDTRDTLRDPLRSSRN